MSFDFGVPEQDLKGIPGCNLRVWPTEGEMTGLVDADAIPYIVGFTSTEFEYLQFKRASDPYQTRIWKDKIDHANYILNTWLSRAGCDSALLYLTDSSSNFRLQIGKVKEYKGQRKDRPKPPFFSEIKTWLFEFQNAHMSDGCEADDDISIEAWRRHNEFAKEYGMEYVFMNEHKKFSDFIIISKDKDLKIIPGWHHPPDGDRVWVDLHGWLEPKYKDSEVNSYEYWPLFDGKKLNPKHLFTFDPKDEEITPRDYHWTKEEETGWEKKFLWYSIDSKANVHCQDVFTRGAKKGEGKYKRIKTGKIIKQNIDKLAGAGLMFFYAQVIMGDPIDNYPGLPGYGPKKAFDILNGATTEQELAERVYAAYLDYYGSVTRARVEMLEQGQLAWMQTRKGELWQLPI